MDKTTIESRRKTRDPNRDLHFCFCGRPADMSCTDAVEVKFTSGENAGIASWTESAPRYGCRTHPVEPMVRFTTDGTSMTAREYCQSTKIDEEAREILREGTDKKWE